MLLPEPCAGSREGTGEASVGEHAGGPIENRNQHRLECRGCPSGRRQHLWGRKGQGRDDFVVLLPAWLALRSGALACPLFSVRLIRSKAEFYPHGRVIAQLQLLAPIMVVAACQDSEMF